MDWRHHAACRDEDPELFFPIGNTGPALLQIDEAKRVCRGCLVMEPCLQWALDSGQDSGVWGGLSEDERRALKRRTRASGPARTPDRSNGEPAPAARRRSQPGRSDHRCSRLTPRTGTSTRTLVPPPG